MPRVTMYESEQHKAKREAREQASGTNAVKSVLFIGVLLGALYALGLI